MEIIKHVLIQKIMKKFSMMIPKRNLLILKQKLKLIFPKVTQKEILIILQVVKDLKIFPISPLRKVIMNQIKIIKNSIVIIVKKDKKNLALKN
jgi:hypothetical protein